MFSPDGRFLAYDSGRVGSLRSVSRGLLTDRREVGGLDRRGRRAGVGPRGRELFYRRGDQMLVVDVENWFTELERLVPR
jgi:hypothetical protein